MKNNKFLQKTNVMTKLFIIKNYQTLYHIGGILMFVLLIKLYGMNELLTFNREVIPVQLILLAINFLWVNFALKKFGVHKFMEEEYKKIKG